MATAARTKKTASAAAPREGDRLLPLMQLARRWGWSRSKLYNLAVRGGIPHLRFNARNDIYFRERDVEAWLQAKTIAAQQGAPTPSAEPHRLFGEECGLTRDEAEAFL